MRAIKQILKAQVPDPVDVFLDDISIKGPKTNYNGEEIIPGVRRYIFKVILILDGVLIDLERAGATISGEKS